MHCLDTGCLRGTSLLANGAAVEHAVVRLAERMARDSRILAGVHLNLLEGRCTAPAASIPLLAAADGFFRHSLGGLCRLLYASRPSVREAAIEQSAIEWRAQTDTVTGLLQQTLGTVPRVYLDGHQHVHAIPALRPALSAVLDAVAVTHVRVPEEPRYYCPAPPKLALAGALRRELLAFWGRSLRRFLASRGVPSPDVFIGAFCSGSMTADRLEAGIARAATLAGKGGLVEIMLHPGGNAPDGNSGGARTRSGGKDREFERFYAAPEREVEKNLVLSSFMRQILAKHDPSWQNPS